MKLILNANYESQAPEGKIPSISTGLLKKLLKTTRNKKKKHTKVAMPARGKLNSIESKIFEALINNGISHEDFMTRNKISRIKRKHYNDE